MCTHVHARVRWAVLGSEDFLLIHSISHASPEFSALLSSACRRQWGGKEKGTKKGPEFSRNVYVDMNRYIHMLSGWRTASSILQSYSCCFQQDNCVAAHSII